MGDLQTARLVENRPFFNVVMDYGGPFIVRESRRRSVRTNNIYLAVFVCMSVKAVHLETMSDISTDVFLTALDRFVARRGISNSIYTHCVTNYVYAAKQLKQLFDEAFIISTQYIFVYVASGILTHRRPHISAEYGRLPSKAPKPI